MTRNPALRPSRAPINRNDLFSSLKRITLTAAAGFVALFIATVCFWK